MLKTIVVLKTGGVYDDRYATRIVKRLQQYADLGPIQVLTDNEKYLTKNPFTSKALMYPDLKGYWAKLELCRPDIDGDIFYVDLDTDIVGDLATVIQCCYEYDKPIMLRDFYFPERLASGVMWLPESYRRKVWEKFSEDPNGHMFECSTYGDQKFFESVFGSDALAWQDLIGEGTIVSYKKDIADQAPPHLNLKAVDASNASIICYHGRPRPHEIEGWFDDEK